MKKSNICPFLVRDYFTVAQDEGRRTVKLKGVVAGEYHPHHSKATSSSCAFFSVAAGWESKTKNQANKKTELEMTRY